MHIQVSTRRCWTARLILSVHRPPVKTALFLNTSRVYTTINSHITYDYIWRVHSNSFTRTIHVDTMTSYVGTTDVTYMYLYNAWRHTYKSLSRTQVVYSTGTLLSALLPIRFCNVNVDSPILFNLHQLFIAGRSHSRQYSLIVPTFT